MRKLIFTLLVLLLVGLSCKKEESPTVLPGWLQEEINDVTSNPNLCDICRVEISEFEGKLYYNLYCDLWSCAYCHFYDEDGNPPDWNADQWNQYIAAKRDIKTVPACQ